MRASGVRVVWITSTYREPKEQARVMFENLSDPSNRGKKSMYKAHGQQVEAVYREFEAGAVRGFSVGFDPAKPFPSPSRAMAGMEARILELEAQFDTGCVSKHQVDPSVLNVIDISARRLEPNGNLSAFVRVLTDSMLVSRIGLPKEEERYHTKHFRESVSCLHLEIPQPRLLIERFNVA